MNRRTLLNMLVAAGAFVLLAGFGLSATRAATPTQTRSPLANLAGQSELPAPRGGAIPAAAPAQGTPTATATACPANYAYTVSSGTILSGTTDIGNHCDDCSTPINLPFSVQIYNQSFNTVFAGSNGHLTFGTANDNYNPGCIPIGGATYAIFPYETDQCTGPCVNVTCTGCGIFTATTGTAPNRVFTVEYRTAYYNSGGNGVPLDYEVQLFEGQTYFDIVYGTINTFSPPAPRNLTVGVQRTNTTQYTSVGCDTTGGTNPPVSSGQRYRYSLAACGTATRTPTTGPSSTATRTAAPSATGTSVAPSPTRTTTPGATSTSGPSVTPGLASSTPTAQTTGVASATATQQATGVASPTRTTVAGSPTATETPCAINFSDVHPTDYFYTPVQYLYCHGVISGYGDGTFRPYNDTTRAQMVKIVVLGFGIAVTTPAGGAYTFHDVPPGAPFFDVIETAAAHNIISGYTCGTGGPGPCDPQNRPYFLPNNPVTRGQLSKIDVIAAGWPQINPTTPTFTDVPAANPFYTVIETAVCHGVVSGYADHTFHPSANATRGQIAKIVYLSILDQPGSCAVTPAAR